MTAFISPIFGMLMVVQSTTVTFCGKRKLCGVAVRDFLRGYFARFAKKLANAVSKSIENAAENPAPRRCGVNAC